MRESTGESLLPVTLPDFAGGRTNEYLHRKLRVSSRSFLSSGVTFKHSFDSDPCQVEVLSPLIWISGEKWSKESDSRERGQDIGEGQD